MRLYAIVVLAALCGCSGFGQAMREMGPAVVEVAAREIPRLDRDGNGRVGSEELWIALPGILIGIWATWRARREAAIVDAKRALKTGELWAQVDEIKDRIKT